MSGIIPSLVGRVEKRRVAYADVVGRFSEMLVHPYVPPSEP